MINAGFDGAGLAYINGLVDGKVPESKTLEYKAELPIFNDSGKKEFLAGVSSFANTSGGYILYGRHI